AGMIGEHTPEANALAFGKGQNNQAESSMTDNGRTAPAADGRTLEFHALAGLYDLLTDEQLQPLVESMQEHGYEQDKPVIMYENRVLDGRNRLRASLKAGVQPTFAEFTGSYDEARAYAARANELRRHDAPETIRKRRQERIAEVGRLKLQRLS